jgi:hypothetical protein
MSKAAFAPHHRWFNGTQYELEVGQFVTSFHQMAQTFDWSEKRVRLFCGRMVRCGRWVLGRAGPGAKSPTLVTVCNYEILQRRNVARGEERGDNTVLTRAKKRPTKGGQEKDDSTIQKKEKNERQFRSRVPRSIGEIVAEMPSLANMASAFDCKPAKIEESDHWNSFSTFPPDHLAEALGQQWSFVRAPGQRSVKSKGAKDG